MRTNNYSANILNQITNRTMPGTFDVIGTASESATVRVNGSTVTERHGEYFRFEFQTNNSAGSVYPSVTNEAVVAGFTNTEVGNVFLPQDPESIAYDNDGNTTSDGRWAMTWDAENRLLSMESHAGAPVESRRKLEFAYDWMGRRISKVVSTDTGSGWAQVSSTRFVYDGWNLIAELSGPTVVRSYVWGLDLSGSMQGAGGVGGLLAVTMGTNIHLPFYDGNGNVMGLVDANTGMSTAQYEYGPFGEPIRVTGSAAERNPFRFSTKYTDGESEWVYYGFRYYKPQSGGWLNRDPLGEFADEHLYLMLQNTAVGLVDYLGMYAVDPRVHTPTTPNAQPRAPIVAPRFHPVDPIAPRVPLPRIPPRVVPPRGDPISTAIFVATVSYAIGDAIFDATGAHDALADLIEPDDTAPLSLVPQALEDPKIPFTSSSARQPGFKCPCLPNGRGEIDYGDIQNGRRRGVLAWVTAQWAERNGSPADLDIVPPGLSVPNIIRGHLWGKQNGGSGKKPGRRNFFSVKALSIS